MKGIVLAGGTGSRLNPITQVCSKQLIPVYDKPMIYYPLSMLMLSGVKDILVITTPQDAPAFERLLGNGSQFGLNLEYRVQEKASGLPEAFIIGENFIKDDSVMLILGDNIFYGDQLILSQVEKAGRENRPSIFAYRVSNPTNYGVVEFNDNGEVLSIEEKPQVPKSNYAITGLYVFDNDVANIARNLKPSARGETEIVDIMKEYQNRGTLNVNVFGRGTAWLDAGTVDSLLDASLFIQTLEKRQGFKVACLEEIALRKGYVSAEQVDEQLNDRNDPYSDYVREIVEMARTGKFR